MRQIVLFSLLFSTALMGQNPIDGVLKWAEQEYKDFRTYPRVNRAYLLIKEGKKNKAKALLEKALNIDKENQKAIDMMVNLCLDQQDNTCVDQYADRAKGVNLAYFYQSRAQQALDQGDYQLSIYEAKKALKYPLRRADRKAIRTLILDAYLKQKAYKDADRFIHRDELNIYELFAWSKISSNLGALAYASDLAKELPAKKEYLDWQLNLLLQQKRYGDASGVMEKIYSTMPTPEHKKELLHLYKLSNQDENIVQLYQHRLEKGCDAYALLYLLDYYKREPKKREALLEANYPYRCLEPKQRAQLSLEWVNGVQKKDPKKAKKIAKEILKHQHTWIESAQARLNLYQIAGEGKRMQEHYASLLSSGCDAYALRYLLDQYHNDVAKRYQLLDKNYPYDCLTERERKNVVLDYFNLLKKRNPKRLKAHLATFLPDKVSGRYGVSIANLYTDLGEKEKARAFRLAYLEKHPKDLNVLKALGYDYLTDHEYPLALHYLSRAAKQDREDKVLLKNIGYACVEQKEYDLAIYYWNQYLESEYDPDILLSLAWIYMNRGDYPKAQNTLDRYAKLQKDKKPPKYLRLRAKLAAETKGCELARDAYKEALAYIRDDADFAHEYVELLRRCGQKQEALKELEALIQTYPDRRAYQKELVYLYEDQKAYLKATQKLEEMIEQDPTNAQDHLALAYDYKKMGKQSKAIKAFKQVIDYAKPEDNVDPIKEEIHYLRKDFTLYVAELARLDSQSTQGVSPIKQSTYNGFGAIELHYRPRFLPDGVDLFASLLHDHDNVQESAQPSVGIRVQPIKDKELFLSAQQMIKAGDSTRSETLLRASLGISTTLKHQKDFSGKLYLDGGYFTKAQTLTLYGNYEVGKTYMVNNNISFTPYLTTGGAYSNDNHKKRGIGYLDVGAGVGVNLRPDATKYETAAYTNRFKLEVRQKYAGNSEDEHALRLGWELFY